MFLFQKIFCHIKEQKLFYIFLLILLLIGFLSGCFYTNLISDADFYEAGVQAEEFIKQAKENELSFHLMLTEELSSYLLIALFSLFLFGGFPIVFLVFKHGFSTGFFLTFLVKCFSMKGFFLGGTFLFFEFLCFLPPLLWLTHQSLSVNRFLISSVLHKSSSHSTLPSELIAIAIALLVTVITVALGVSFKVFILPPLTNYLFL